METFEKVAAAERPAHIRELPIVTGHLALDFANTVDDPDGPNRYDHIGTYAGLLHWAVRVDILPTPRAQELYETGSPSLRAAHALRHVLTETFGGIASGQPQADEHWAGLRPFVTDSYRHSDLVPQKNSYVMRWPDDRPDARAVAGRPRRRRPDHGTRTRPAQAVRRLPVGVPRPVAQRQPPLVLDGGLRHPRQDAAVRHQTSRQKRKNLAGLVDEQRDLGPVRHAELVSITA